MSHDDNKHTIVSTNATTTTTVMNSSNNNSIEYSPCTNTGESHTSTKDEIQLQHAIAVQIILLQSTTTTTIIDDGVGTAATSTMTPMSTTTTIIHDDEIPIQQKRYPIIHYHNNADHHSGTATAATASNAVSPSTVSVDNTITSSTTTADIVTTTANTNTATTTTTTASVASSPSPSPPSVTGPERPIKNFYCWSSRGTINVTAMQNLIRHGYNRNYNNTTNGSSTDMQQQSVPGATNISSSTTTMNNSSSGIDTGNTTSQMINYWDPVIAMRDNVLVRRPSHDAWGIPKIVLIYCDDFLQNIYTFPWLFDQKYEFRSSIQPVLDILHIPMERIVRMLFASLPTGSTIPMHYDTGEWVKYTHRVHVPIVVHDETKILFRCGTTPQTLQRISCHPGHVFEINNQTYHTVSNCDTDYRVHLILDYIDEEYYNKTHNQPPQRHTLQRGEIIYQTRRSIDRFINFGQRNTPTFMILGSQKAGTTYLFECIMSHPLAIKPKNQRRETHSLDWNYKQMDTIQKQQQFVQSFYYYKELQYHPSCFTGDSTPSYLMDYIRVIPRIKQLYQHPIKFIVLCRNPIHRAISHYAMATCTKNITDAQRKSRGIEWRQKSFASIVIEDLIHMKQCGLLPYWTIPGLTIHTKIDDNIPGIQFILDSIDTAIFNSDKFHSFIGSKQEETAWTKYITNHVRLHTGSYGLLSRGIYHIQIRMWIQSFSSNNDSFLIYKFEAMTDRSQQRQPFKAKMMEQIWDHVQVPNYELPTEVLKERQNSREYNSLDIINPSSKVYKFLYRFYQVHNEQLHILLRQQQQHQTKYDQELFDYHWGESSVQWTESTTATKTISLTEK